MANFIVPPEEITTKSKRSYSQICLYKNGSSVNRPNASNAIAIQDLVKRLNGSGFKVT